MKIETLHTHPASLQADPDAETLPMPVAGNDIGHPDAQRACAKRTETPSKLRGTWHMVRAAMASLPQRARQAQAQGRNYVAAEPVKATMMAAAGGAALAMILRAAARRGRH